MDGPRPDSLDAFERLVALSAAGEPVRLAECALWLASSMVRGGIDVAVAIDQLDSLAAQVETPTADGVRRLVFDQLGFVGNSVDYYSPDNSRLDWVLRTRMGIPITLAIVFADVANSVGEPLRLTNSPGHVLVVDPRAEAWYDPFDLGRRFDVDGATEFLSQFIGGKRATKAMLGPATDLQVVKRMLNNLRAIHARGRNRVGLTAVEQLTCRLPGVDPRHRLALAKLLVDGGDVAGAAEVLEQVAESGVGSADRIRQRAERLRAKLN